MKTKKKLLITLGCSYTEGVGCYDLKLVNNMIVNGKSPQTWEFYDSSRQRFHEYGWPAILQKFLKYDHLINLGFGGSSNSHQFKRFIEEFSEKDLTEDFDVLVIWFLTYAGRISFYSNGHIRSVSSSEFPGELMENKSLRESYYGFIQDINLDTFLETLFYFKTLETICNKFNYNLLFTNAEYQTSQLFEKFYPSKINLDQHIKKYFNEDNFLSILINPEYHSVLRCHHPNELGYKIIAEKMFKIIELEYPHLISSTEPTTYINEYRDSKIWKM